jgi:predicted aldo/keto reductase-like oxidoreductase
MAEKGLTRRQFLRDVGVTCATTGLIVSPLAAGVALGKEEPEGHADTQANMVYQPLGKTGLNVSAVSYGVMQLEDRAVLFEALDKGINLFDTAHVYKQGNNEKLLGSVLKEYGRDKAYIVTKVPPYERGITGKKLRDPSTMEEMLEKSLKRLQTHYVDVLLLHNIVDPNWPKNEDMMLFLARQKQAGKARFVGISFHAQGSNFVDIVNESLKTRFYDVFLGAYNFKSPPAHAEVLRRARSQQVGIIAMKTQAGGYEKGVTGGLNPHQAALKWVLDKDFIDCAIPGMVNRLQLRQNIAAVGKKPGWSDRKTLDSYYAAIKDRYCVRCGECASSCLAHVDIPSVNRSLTYWEGYGDLELARSAYSELSSKENARACMDCSAPVCRCANGIKIGERMRYAHQVLS